MRLAIIALVSSATPTLAEEIRLGLPLVCDLVNGPCYIQQFTDHDAGPDATDFMCGSLSYDGHKGTDFALPSLAMQAEGVEVVASADGVVKGVRDAMPDIMQGDLGAPDVSNVECGNGVVIDHGDGWETQYCHMALGSITVASGQQVTAGTVLGKVGLSGQTQFPHVHLSVRKDGEVIDPFDMGGAATCGDVAVSMFIDTPPTPAGGLVSAGFAPDIPEYAAVKAGTAGAEAIAPTDNMVAWGFVFGTRVGDVLHTVITGPEGEVFDGETALDRQQAMAFRASGKRAPDGGWPTGDYTATIEMIRDGAVLDTQTTTVTVR